MSSAIVGVLPMGGDGTRLGLPFLKGLAPTIVGSRIVPLYQHSVERLRRVTDDIVFVLSPRWAGASLPGRVFYPPQHGLTGAIRFAAGKRPDSILAIALPDSVWWPEDGFDRLRLHLGNHDGALGIFRGSSLVLDAVELDAAGKVRDVTRHDDPPAPGEEVDGWGCLLLRSEVAAQLTDDVPLARQLADLDLIGVRLHGPYYDLGTTDRYIAHHVLEA